MFLSGITSPLWILKVKPGRPGFLLSMLFPKHPAASENPGLGCFCGFSGHMRLGLWTFVSCCALGWAGAVVCPWLGADKSFDANGLIQLKWCRHLTLSSCTECPGIWWPGKEAVKEWDNFVTIYLTFICKWINDISSKKATYVWHLLCMSVIFIAVWHNPNT